MMRTLSLRSFTYLAVAVLLLAASCSSGTTDTTHTVTTATTAASTTTAASDEEPLVLVAFGDSVISYPNPDSGSGAIGAYANMLEKEFGVPVEVRNRASFGSSPTDLIKALDSERLRKELAEADVVLLEIPQGDTNPAFPTATGWQGLDPAGCGGDDNLQCLRDYVTENKASVEAIFSALTAVCDPSTTLIRALDVYMLHVEDALASGILHITNPYFVETQEYLEETAARYGIPVAQVYDEFMGPDGTDDPQDRGLVMTDQRHTTEEGAQLIAEMLHDLGYDYSDW